MLQVSGAVADPANVKRCSKSLAAVLVAFALCVAPASATAKSKAKPCKDAKLVPTKASQMKRIERATRCLINNERKRHHLARLADNNALRKSSRWQGYDMLSHSYFDHSRPDGPAFADRILQFGYAQLASGYEIGENIGWASESIASPKQMVKMWMDSPPHRENILTGPFRDQAVDAIWSDGGVGGDYQSSNGPFVIYVNQFGRQYGPMRKR